MGTQWFPGPAEAWNSLEQLVSPLDRHTGVDAQKGGTAHETGGTARAAPPVSLSLLRADSLA
jgi:hypothetical protein